MGFGFAGAAAGAAKSLEDIVAERILQQKLEAEIADRQARTALDEKQLNQQALEADTASKQRQQQIDMQAGDRRERSNQSGVRRMLGEAITQRTGPMGPDDRRGLAALQVEAGDAPTLLNEPTPQRDPIADYEAKKKLDRQYDRPAAGAKPGVHVVGGNLVDDSGKVLFTDPKTKVGVSEASPYANERAARTIQSVDELMGQVGRGTTGYGSLLANVPESNARNFKAQLDTLKANIAFNELTQMRESSKTGGALGAVSEREMQLLQSALGALDQGQSPENIKAQLQKIKESVQRWQAAQGGGPVAPVSSHDGATPAGPKRLRFDAKGNPIP